ncbi:hypothetical protein FRB96_007355 [Tulasnella sp. 330]|nr:hypothetical protein FRB96_007355 [Tulasnella sp. 330]
MSPKPTKHFVFATIPSFSHLRAESRIISDLIRSDPSLIFTVLAVKFTVPLAAKEIAGHSLSEFEVSRVRIVGIGQTMPPTKETAKNWFLDVLDAEKHELRETYHLLARQTSITCTHSDTAYDYSGIPPPCAVFVDFFAPDLGPFVKDMTPNVKVIGCWPLNAGPILSHYTPDEFGGIYYSWEARMKAVIERGEADGQTFDGLAESTRIPFIGKVIRDNDGLERYDYERSVQEVPDTGARIKINMAAVKATSHDADAAIACTTSSFQPNGLTALREWYEGKIGKRLFVVGPPVPQSVISSSQGQYQAPGAAAPSSPFHPIFAFLNRQPPKSVMLISFGTVFYPTQPWQVEAMYRTLLDTRTQFIASKMSAMFQPLSSELEDAIKKSGIGMIADFVPQREVLGHPSIGSFLTHGGSNSMWESIFAGVVNVFWPIIGDQVDHAAYMSQVLDCGWELVQVRTGEGAQRPLRGGKVEGTPDAVAAELRQVLVELESKVGERRRKNLQVLRQKSLEAVADGGEAQKGIQDLLRYASGGV